MLLFFTKKSFEAENKRITVHRINRQKRGHFLNAITGTWLKLFLHKKAMFLNGFFTHLIQFEQQLMQTDEQFQHIKSHCFVWMVLKVIENFCIEVSI